METGQVVPGLFRKEKEAFNAWVKTWCDGVDSVEYQWELHVALMDKIAEMEISTAILAERYLCERAVLDQLRKSVIDYRKMTAERIELNKKIESLRVKKGLKT